jgi:hypothetical protein
MNLQVEKYPVAFEALRPADIRNLDQRRWRSIDEVVVGDQACWPCHNISVVETVAAYRGSRKFLNGRRTPHGYVLFRSGTAAVFTGDTWHDGRVLYEGRVGYLFGCSILTCCAVRLESERTALVREAAERAQACSVEDHATFRELVVGEAFGVPSAFAAGTTEDFLRTLQLGTLRDLLDLLHSTPA